MPPDFLIQLMHGTSRTDKASRVDSFTRTVRTLESPPHAVNSLPEPPHDIPPVPVSARRSRSCAALPGICGQSIGPPSGLSTRAAHLDPLASPERGALRSSTEKSGVASGAPTDGPLEAMHDYSRIKCISLAL